MVKQIVLESNLNHATITDSGISPTLPTLMGGQSALHHKQAVTWQIILHMKWKNLHPSSSIKRLE